LNMAVIEAGARNQIGWMADDVKERGIDELTPIWNVLDLTPQGRGKFYASLEYGTKVQAARGR